MNVKELPKVVDADTLVVDQLDRKEAEALYIEIKYAVKNFGIYNGRNLRANIEELDGHFNVPLGQFSLCITKHNFGEVCVEPSHKIPGKWLIKLPGFTAAQ